MLAILVSLHIAAWGLPPSLLPQPTQSVEKQTQPAQHDYAAEPSIEKQKHESDERTREKENDHSRITRIVKFVREYNAEVVAISTAVMALFTVALFAATFALWFGGERHSRRELRAYISVSPGFVFFFATPPTTNIVVRCILANHGKTPAFRLNTVFDIGVFPIGLREPPHQAARVITNEAAIFPGAHIDADFTNSRQLTNQEANQVIADTHCIYVWGTARYRDAFNKLRWTRFFASVGGPHFFAAVSATPPTGFQWSFGHQHNQAT